MWQERGLANYWFTDEEYAKILDELVVVCVDTLIYSKERGIFLGRRQRLPIYDWWIFGGRMQARETFVDAARRGVKRELGVNLDRTPDEIGYFDLVWEMREEKPQENGCHVLLIAMKCEVSEDEASDIAIAGNDHSEGKWFKKEDILKTNFHPRITEIIEKSGVLSLIP